MNELQTQMNQLPTTLQELEKFVVVGREKLTAVRAEIRAIDKVGLAKEVRAQKLREAQALGEAVLDAEVRLGELMAAIPKTPGRRIDLEPGNSGVIRSKKQVLEEAGFSEQQARRFEQLYENPDVVDKAKRDAREAGEIVTRTAVLQEIAEQKKPYIVNNTGTTEWYTPAKYIESARIVLGSIDLDPCSNVTANESVKASCYYTAEEDGLLQEWYGRIWLNPPYSDAATFIDKLLQSDEVEQAIVLVNNATETSWFRKLVEKSSAIVFHTGRLRFVNPAGGDPTPPMQGQAFVYLGQKPQRFLDEFLQYGWGTTL